MCYCLRSQISTDGFIDIVDIKYLQCTIQIILTLVKIFLTLRNNEALDEFTVEI